MERPCQQRNPKHLPFRPTPSLPPIKWTFASLGMPFFRDKGWKQEPMALLAHCRPPFYTVNKER